MYQNYFFQSDETQQYQKLLHKKIHASAAAELLHAAHSLARKKEE